MKCVFLAVFLCLMFSSCRDKEPGTVLRQGFLDPPEEARPWVFWYWMNAAVSAEGITADLEAMKDAGIGGAYLMPIRGPLDPPGYEPPALQLSPHWWDLLMHAFREADRLGLKIGMHVSDGFALAGGPWISPELSMQKLVWTETLVRGGNPNPGGTSVREGTAEPGGNDVREGTAEGEGKKTVLNLPQPETIAGYYRDIAVFAFPVPGGSEFSTDGIRPRISSNIPGINASFLSDPEGEELFRSDDSCWIRYEFEEPFLCRNITIRTRGYNYASHRLWVQAGDDGIVYTTVCRLDAPRHGWQEDSETVVHAIPPTRAKYFRFVYGKSGMEPGAEDLEMAKWSPSLRTAGIYLSGFPRIHQYKGKNASVWRISPSTTGSQVADDICIPKENLLDISEWMDSTGKLSWEIPEGEWTILRMGHTSTGRTNYTGGGGLGLECDKLNPEAAGIQFEHWFARIADSAGSGMRDRVLKYMHIDSWECGSQNWSPVFREEFRKRRGYDPVSLLPVMAGVPVSGIDESERYLHDIRVTVSELLIDNFYEVIVRSAHRYGCEVSAECDAPTMCGDGMLHYQSVDLPMGEFWYRSPTHDKPNDMLDAISGAHIYGKNIIQAEAFTELRMNWTENPSQVKSLGDRNLALGANRLFIHVYAHNPWMDRKPGMTLSRIGLYFQRDQTWWKLSRSWVAYLSRCQYMLQQGRPVTDIAVFTGEEIPRRAVLPDRLVPVLPGIFGEDVVSAERVRLQNNGAPVYEMPEGVGHSANMADPADWCDPLHGYGYDCLNPDALFRLAGVKEGRITLPGGASYGLLVVPGRRRMDPSGNLVSDKLAERLQELGDQGATILVPSGLRSSTGTCLEESTRGKILYLPWKDVSFGALGIEPDLLVTESGTGERAGHIAWSHRTLDGSDIYFVSNQAESSRELTFSFRMTGKWPDIYDPLSREIRQAGTWEISGGRTLLPLKLDPGASRFIVFERETRKSGINTDRNQEEPGPYRELTGPWSVSFDPGYGGPGTPVIMEETKSWHLSEDTRIRYYSGMAVYTRNFNQDSLSGGTRYWLGIEGLHDMAEVFLNDSSCGIIWTEPYRAEISGKLQRGENRLEIRVSNTWANRMIGDQRSGERGLTRTQVPFQMKDKPLQKAGICGKVSLYHD